MPVNGALAMSRLSIIVSSSLAQDSHFLEFVNLLNLSDFNLSQPNTTQNTTTSSCHDPCADLQHKMTHAATLIPFGIGLVFFILGALPVIIFRSRYRVHGVRSCLWVLVELWVQLVVTFALFGVDRAQAYVWALHAVSHVLACWMPKNGVMPYPGLQRMAALAGSWCVGLFAWQLGPPIGLAAWYRQSDALCGWKVHLVAVVGVELVAWGLGMFEGAVTGLG